MIQQEIFICCQDEDNGSYAAFSKRLARMEEEQGLIAERQKQMLRMIEDLHRKQTGKKTPETDGNALEKYKIDYLPIKVEPGKEAEGITKLVALETKLSDPEFKRALVSFYDKYVSSSELF